MYIADSYDHRIRKVTASTGIISTVAGTGVSSYSGDGGAATAATMNLPEGIAVDSAGNKRTYTIPTSNPAYCISLQITYTSLITIIALSARSQLVGRTHPGNARFLFPFLLK